MRLWLAGFLWLGMVVAQAAPESLRRAPEWLDPDRRAPLGSQYFASPSKTVSQRVSCLVWLPPAYERFPNRRFPVIYWLHGANGNQRKCSESFLPAYIRALKERDVPPAIVVAVNGIPGSFYGNSQDGNCPIETVFIQDLIPAIDGAFRTQANREGRLIAGFSMGGFGTARLGLKYPDLFGAMDIMSAGPLPPGPGVPGVLRPVFGNQEDEMPESLARRNAEALRSGSLIRITCGGKDRLLDGNQALHEYLESLNIPHVFHVVPGVDHNPVDMHQRIGNLFFRFHQRAFQANR